MEQGLITLDDVYQLMRRLLILLPRELVLPLDILRSYKVTGLNPALLKLVRAKTTKSFKASPIIDHTVYQDTEKCASASRESYN